MVSNVIELIAKTTGNFILRLKPNKLYIIAEKKFEFQRLISILTACFDFLKNSEPLTQFKIYFMTQFSWTVPGVSPYPRSRMPRVYFCAPGFYLNLLSHCFIVYHLRPSASNCTFCAPGFRMWRDIISHCREQRLGRPDTPRPSAQIFDNEGRT